MFLFLFRPKTVNNRRAMSPLNRSRHSILVYDMDCIGVMYTECRTKSIALYAVSNCTESKQQRYLAEDIIAVYEDNTHYTSATCKKALVNIQSSEAIGNKPIAEQKARRDNMIAVEKVRKDCGNIYKRVPQPLVIIEYRCHIRKDILYNQQLPERSHTAYSDLRGT